MCGLVIACFALKVNPDNIATPIAATLGDLVTLAVLGLLSTALFFSTGMRAMHPSPAVPKGLYP